MPPTTPPPPTVYVVDDDPPLRDSLVALLEALGFRVRAFSTAGAFHRYYRADMPGCLLLDVRLPRQSGLALHEQLVNEGKHLPVIFLTAHTDVAAAVAAMKAGAVEYLTKPFDCDVLVNRIRRALALDERRRRREAEFAALVDRLSRLTPRERQTLALLQTGAPNKAIATQLAVTERAVEMRRSSIMRKLQVRSTAEVIKLATTHRVLADLRRTE